ncbi:MAG: hypothetical protein AABX33_03165, partial [Nanoarchaeota archaeon]
MGLSEVENMKRTKAYIKNKKENSLVDKIFFKLSDYFTSTLKLTIALALFLIAAFFISGAGVTVENGTLN